MKTDVKQIRAALKKTVSISNPYARLKAIDKIIGGYGVECADDLCMYVNMGDTYDTTAMYVFSSHRFVVGDWGTLVERQAN